MIACPQKLPSPLIGFALPVEEQAYCSFFSTRSPWRLLTPATSPKDPIGSVSFYTPHRHGSCRRSVRASAAPAKCGGDTSRQRWLHGKGSEQPCQTAGPTITPSTGKEIPSTLNCPLWFAGRCQNVLQP